MVLVQVGETDFEDSVLESILGNFQSLGLVDEGLSDVPGFKEGGGLDRVPLLSSEGIHDFLLEALLSLGQSLVLPDGHVVLLYCPVSCSSCPVILVGMCNGIFETLPWHKCEAQTTLRLGLRLGLANGRRQQSHT